jgi:hypothetical protein
MLLLLGYRGTSGHPTPIVSSNRHWISWWRKHQHEGKCHCNFFRLAESLNSFAPSFVAWLRDEREYTHTEPSQHLGLFLTGRIWRCSSSRKLSAGLL